MQDFPEATWEDMLPAIRFGLTVAIQPSGYSAFQLLYGTRLGPHMVLTDPMSVPSKQDEVLTQRWPDLYVLRKEAMENIKHATKRMKEAYDRRHQARPLCFVEGDYVWLVQERSLGAFHKWAKCYIGLFLIVATCAENMVQLVTVEGNNLLPSLVHTERLKRFVPEKTQPFPCN